MKYWRTIISKDVAVCLFCGQFLLKLNRLFTQETIFHQIHRGNSMSGMQANAEGHWMGRKEIKWIEMSAPLPWPFHSPLWCLSETNPMPSLHSSYKKLTQVFRGKLWPVWVVRTHSAWYWPFWGSFKHLESLPTHKCLNQDTIIKCKVSLTALRKTSSPCPTLKMNWNSRVENEIKLQDCKWIDFANTCIRFGIRVFASKEFFR